MGQEAHPAGCGRSAGFGDDDGRVPEWEDGLPSGGDLAPLFQTLITPELASAFGIMPEPPRTILDVQRASSDTIASIRRQVISSSSSNSDLTLRMIPSFAAAAPEDPGIVEGEGSASEDGGGCCSSEAVRCLDSVEEADSPVDLENPNSDDATRAQKRPRLVWTSQLHRRFVDVVDYLGVRNAVPKTIMHLMNVDGLTRENVASHLQKYRLYLKRNEASDLYETPVAMPMPGAAAPSALPMPVLGMAQNGAGAHVTVVPVNRQHCAVVYHGFGAHHPYAAFEERRMDFTGGSKFGPMAPYQQAFPRDR